MRKGSVKRDSKSAAGVVLGNIEIWGSGGYLLGSKSGDLISAYRLGSLISTLRALAFWIEVVHDRVAYVRTLLSRARVTDGALNRESVWGGGPPVGIPAVLLYVIYT